MGTSLKDALMKAGVKTSKMENMRPKVSPTPNNKGQPVIGKEKREILKHQEQRNFCEVCEQICPDVEFYKHKNPTIDAEWICLRCADRNSIPDKFRTSAQSDVAKKGMFRREFGETLDPRKQTNDHQHSGPREGNHRSNHSGNQRSQNDFNKKDPNRR